MAEHLKYFILVLLVYNLSFLKGQNNINDSLYKLLKNSKHDTDKVKLFLQLGAQYRYSNYDSAIILYKKAQQLALKSNHAVYFPESLRQLAWVNYLKTDFNTALKLYSQALVFIDSCINAKNSRQKKLIALKGSIIGNEGVVYLDQSNYIKALDCFYKALKISEQTNNQSAIAIQLGNIAIVYDEQKDYKQALLYNFKALEIKESLGEKNEIANTLGNIGILYQKLNNNDLALVYYLKAQKLFQEVENINSQGLIFLNIGNIYNIKKDYTHALNYFDKALLLVQQAGNKDSEALVLSSKALSYGKLKKFTYSQSCFLKAINLSKENKLIYSLQSFYASYSEMLADFGKHAEALEAFKQHAIYKDSLYNESNKKAIVQKEMQYEFDKKQTADSLKLAEERKVASLKSRAEKNQRYFLYAGLILVLIFSGFMFNRYKVTQRQKLIISKQKDLVDEKQKEILDSIRYAKRIQQALLPNNKYIERFLKP